MFQARQYQSVQSAACIRSSASDVQGIPRIFSDWPGPMMTNEPMPWFQPPFSKVFVNEAYVSQIEGLPEANYSNTCVLLSLKTPLLHFQWLSELQSLTMSYHLCNLCTNAMQDESQQLLRQLRSRLTQCYRHRWQEGDVLASWDQGSRGGVQVPTSNTEVRKKWGFHSMM